MHQIALAPLADISPLGQQQDHGAGLRSPQRSSALPGTTTLQELTRVLAASAGDIDRTSRFPFENFDLLQSMGLIGAVVPKAAGGSGATLAEARQVIAAVARGEPSTALVLTMSYVVHRILARPESRWPKELRDAVWHSAVSEGALVNNLRVEPDLGSPARGGMPATTARQIGRQWCLFGQKVYSTGIPLLRWLCVWGRTDEPEPRVGIFLVDRHDAALATTLRVVETWDHLGLRASGSHDVVFEGVVLPIENAVDIRLPGDWPAHPEAIQNAWMIGLIGTLYDAVANEARDWLLDFLEQRRPSNLPAGLASVPRIQQGVGQINALLLTNKTLLDDLARRTDQGQLLTSSETGLVKLNVTENAIRAVQLALELTGNHGLSRHNRLERHLRDVLCSRVHTPQSDSILLAAGAAAFASRRRVEHD